MSIAEGFGDMARRRNRGEKRAANSVAEHENTQPQQPGSSPFVLNGIEEPGLDYSYEAVDFGQGPSRYSFGDSLEQDFYDLIPVPIRQECTSQPTALPDSYCHRTNHLFDNQPLSALVSAAPVTSGATSSYDWNSYSRDAPYMSASVQLWQRPQAPSLQRQYHDTPATAVRPLSTLSNFTPTAVPQHAQATLAPRVVGYPERALPRDEKLRLLYEAARIKRQLRPIFIQYGPSGSTRNQIVVACVNARRSYSLISSRLATELQLKRMPLPGYPPGVNCRLRTAGGAFDVSEFVYIQVKKSKPTSGIPEVTLAVPVRPELHGENEMDDGNQYQVYLGSKALDKGVEELMKDESNKTGHDETASID